MTQSRTETSTSDANLSRLPAHVAIIMDGNGRWARNRGLPRFAGHRAGSERIEAVLTECDRLGIRQLTLYSFSTENWNRPQEEVSMLMNLYVDYMRQERTRLAAKNIRFAQIGRTQGLSQQVIDEMQAAIDATKHCTGTTFCLAVNYGSRAEIADAVRQIAQDVKDGKLQPDEVDEKVISNHLYTAGMPDPDLLIRTAGEMRLSNYLLWQISYAELYVTDTLWPDFGIPELHKALENYAQRNRKFGGLNKGA